MTDFSFYYDGSVVLLSADTSLGQDWVDQYLPDDCMRFGQAYVIEPRYADNIFNAIVEEGMTICQE